MSISRIQGNGAHESIAASPHSPTDQELERRLCQQVEHNAQLDTEVRYLLQELAIRKEFIAQLEAERVSIHALAERQGELLEEFAAYRARMSHRIIDRVVAGIHRRPWLYRPLRQGARITIVVAKRWRSRPIMVVPESAESMVGGSTLPTAHHHTSS